MGLFNILNNIKNEMNSTLKVGTTCPKNNSDTNMFKRLFLSTKAVQQFCVFHDNEK